MPSVTIYLPDEMYFEIKRRALERGLKLSVYLRALIEKGLAEDDIEVVGVEE